MGGTSLVQHQKQCTICRHPERHEIEHQFVHWTSPKKIVAAFKVTKPSLYRHAAATNLHAKRQQNVRSALERIIEHADEVQVNGYCVVQACAAMARINAKGEWVSRSETINMTKLFERMTADELERYARDGSLPEWFPVMATGSTVGSEDEPSDEAEEETLKPIR